MAINDDDKKFIKNTINDALSNFEAKTESKRKLFDLKRQEEDKKAREEYLKELKERDAKGEATIAQKFEMLKLSVDNAIPEDLKDAWSGSKQAIGKGANQLGKGLSTINKKIMMSNPLTAMLYNNRDLFGAGFNIAAGGLKMGWGALKGLGTGAAGATGAGAAGASGAASSSSSAGALGAFTPSSTSGVNGQRESQVFVSFAPKTSSMVRHPSRLNNPESTKSSKIAGSSRFAGSIVMPASALQQRTAGSCA